MFNPSFGSKKLIFRELDRPFETAPKTTREPTSIKSRRAYTPSRVTRLRRLMRPSSSKRLMCLPFEKTVRTRHGPVELHSKWCSGYTSIVLVARWFFAHVFSFLLSKIVQSEPGLLCDGRHATASATQRCIRSIELFAGFRPQVRV